MEYLLRIPTQFGNRKLGLLELRVGYESDVANTDTLGCWRKTYGANFNTTTLYAIRPGRSYFEGMAFDTVFPLSKETTHTLLTKPQTPRRLSPDEGFRPIMLHEICTALYNGAYVLDGEGMWVPFAKEFRLSTPMLNIIEVLDVVITPLEFTRFCHFNGKSVETI